MEAAVSRRCRRNLLILTGCRRGPWRCWNLIAVLAVVAGCGRGGGFAEPAGQAGEVLDEPCRVAARVEGVVVGEVSQVVQDDVAVGRPDFSG